MKKTLSLLILPIVIMSALLLFTSCKKETVSFMIGDEVYRTSTIKDGVVKQMPEIPSRDDMCFLEWFTDDGVWNGEVTNGMKIYASWISLSKNDDGSYTVTGLSDRHTSVIDIPANHNGKKITSIADKALFANSVITEVKLPSTVASIGNAAFAECANLTSIVVDTANESFKSVDGNLYSKDGTALLQYAIAKNDTEFAIPEDVTVLAPYTFSKATHLQKVSIPEGLTLIPTHAFYSCKSLATVEIPEGSLMTSIDASAFSSCSSLTEITIPKHVNSIGEFAFFSCTSLKNVYIARRSELANIYDFAFTKTDALERIYYDGSYSKLTLNVAKNDTVKELKKYFFDYDSAGSYLVPEGAWTPTAEYAGITYGVWLTEDDYLAGLAPTKWYISTEILSAHIGTVDANGEEYEDPDFIPGYVHLFADVINPSASSQLVSGQTQKIIINLAGYTLTLSKGIRIGGSYGPRPEASMTIKNGTIDFIAGQIQPRLDSTFIMESVIFNVLVTNHNIFYGAGADLVIFKNSEMYVTTGATFMLTVSSLEREERCKMLFESTDVYYLETPASDALFRIHNSTSRIVAWDIVFDSNSSLNGNVNKLMLLKEATSKGNLYTFQYQQTLTFEEGCILNNNDIESYDTYWIIKIDIHEDTELDPEELPAVELPANDEYCSIIKN